MPNPNRNRLSEITLIAGCVCMIIFIITLCWIMFFK
uniref:Uncharacterized protein n=1 Tax=CrAss-like virus sp. ctUXy6 TaxID=2825835 RepID=A0A8S5V7G0_9CAUD|nr:MAG TPA: hypothetical protein [CrAss-like virus sp. ctUXy6]